jgi:photosystem II stability/assembly factor-like uncharacterized protein
MQKLKIIFTLIFGIQMAGYSQWEEKNISTERSLTGVDFVTDNIGFVAGGNFIYKTENGGDDWTTSYTTSDLVVYEDILAIDSEHIIAVGNNLASGQSVILKSEDGGASWNEVSVSGFSFLKSVFFISSNIGFCSGSGGAILKSLDGGSSWEALNSGTNLNLESVFFVNDMVGIAVGGSPSSTIIVKTEDGGTTWNPISSPSNNNLQSVFFTDENNGYIAGWNGEILKTEDGGDSWTTQTSVSMNGNLEVTFTDKNTGYIVGGTASQTLIQKTTNGGELWEDISPPLGQGLIGIHFPSLDVGYAVGTRGTVIKTESGGVMTSTSNLVLSDAFKVFPNPTNGALHVQSENNNRIDKINIYDTNGRFMNLLHSGSNTSEVDLSNYEPNVYYLEIHSGTKVEMRKIVKI